MSKSMDILKNLCNTKYSYMELEAIKQIFNEGLDPFNPKDVKKFWKRRGIDLDEKDPLQGHYSYLKK